MEKKLYTEWSTSTGILGTVVVLALAAGVYGITSGKLNLKQLTSLLQKWDENISTSLEQVVKACQQAWYVDISKCNFVYLDQTKSIGEILIQNWFDEKSADFAQVKQIFSKINWLNSSWTQKGGVYLLPNKEFLPKLESIESESFSQALKIFAKACVVRKCLISTPANQASTTQWVEDFLKSNWGWSANVKSSDIHKLFQNMNWLKDENLEQWKYYIFASTSSLNNSDKNTQAVQASVKAQSPKIEAAQIQPEFVTIKAESSDTFYNLFRKAGYSEISTFAKFVNAENKNFDVNNNIWAWNSLSIWDENSKPINGKEYKIRNLKAWEKIDSVSSKTNDLVKTYFNAVAYIKENNLDKYPLISQDLFLKLALRESSWTHTKNWQTIQTPNRVWTKSIWLTQMTPPALEDVNNIFWTNFSLEDIKNSEQKNVISSILYYSILENSIPQVKNENYKTSLILAAYNSWASTINAIYNQAGKPENWDQMRGWMLIQMYWKNQDYEIDKDMNWISYRNFFTQDFDKNKKVIQFETVNWIRTWNADKFQEIIKYVEIINFPQNPQASIKTNLKNILS